MIRKLLAIPFISCIFSVSLMAVDQIEISQKEALGDCVICQEREITTITLPCRCKNLCSECAEKMKESILQKCPMCRAEFREIKVLEDHDAEQEKLKKLDAIVADAIKKTGIRNAGDFIELTKASSSTAYTLAKVHPQFIASFFTKPADFIELTRASSSTAYILAKAHPQFFASFFTKPADFIELTKASSFTADILVRAHSKDIASLFTNLADFIKLTEASYSTGSILTRAQPKDIASLIKNFADLEELNRAILSHQRDHYGHQLFR